MCNFLVEYSYWNEKKKNGALKMICGLSHNILDDKRECEKWNMSIHTLIWKREWNIYIASVAFMCNITQFLINTLWIEGIYQHLNLFSFFFYFLEHFPIMLWCNWYGKWLLQTNRWFHVKGFHIRKRTITTNSSVWMMQSIWPIFLSKIWAGRKKKSSSSRMGRSFNLI